MKPMRNGLILLGVSLWLSACVVLAPPDEVKSPEMGMVFGNIQARETITRIEFREYGKLYMPPMMVPPRVLVFENGDFMVENLPPGKYYIAAVYSRFKDYSLVKDNRSAYQNVIQVYPGQLSFAGSYVIHEIGDGVRFRQNIEMRRVRKPAERDLLRNLYDFTAGTGWQQMIERRLTELQI